MKKQWIRPKAVVEKFEPNEYIAACFNVKCMIPSENAGFDPEHAQGTAGANQFMHSATTCGADDGSVIVTDENGNVQYMQHVKSRGSTGACALFEDAAHTQPKTVVHDQDTVYFVTVSKNGDKSWNHHGTAQLAGNHS